MTNKRDTAGALRWIAQLLQTLGVPFHISGGLAARAYGSAREVDRPDDRENVEAMLKAS
jgi:hypothetical protein